MVFMTPLSRPGFSGKRSVSGDLKAPQNLEEIYRGIHNLYKTIQDSRGTGSNKGGNGGLNNIRQSHGPCADCPKDTQPW